MMKRAVLIWIFGLLTIVPYATYYLFMHAPRDEYALLIVFVLFWIFGYWGVVGPLLAALKVRFVYQSIERAQKRGNVMEALRSQQTQDAVIDFIATEHGIPRFLAAKVYRLLLNKLSERDPTGATLRSKLP